MSRIVVAAIAAGAGALVYELGGGGVLAAIVRAAARAVLS